MRQPLSRRGLISSAGLLGAGLALGAGRVLAQHAPAHGPAPAHAPATAHAPAAAAAHAHTDLTAAQALARLREGNHAFVDGRVAKGVINEARRVEVAAGQTPFAAFVSCSDSRVPPEHLFGCGLGDLFVVRNAGNTVDTVARGSLQYAVAQLGVPLIVVLGHERCGAVAAAASVVTGKAKFPGAIGQVTEPIIPAVIEAQSHGGDLVDNSVRANVKRTVARLRDDQEDVVLRPALRAGKLRVVGATYDLDTGVAVFFDL
jgi:carbonic anhydrase